MPVYLFNIAIVYEVQKIKRKSNQIIKTHKNTLNKNKEL